MQRGKFRKGVQDEKPKAKTPEVNGNLREGDGVPSPETPKGRRSRRQEHKLWSLR